jgi:hypothetical protein
MRRIGGTCLQNLWKVPSQFMYCTGILLEDQYLAELLQLAILKKAKAVWLP